MRKSWLREVTINGKARIKIQSVHPKLIVLFKNYYYHYSQYHHHHHYYCCVYVHVCIVSVFMCVCVCVSMHVEFKGQFLEVSSFICSC